MAIDIDDEDTVALAYRLAARLGVDVEDAIHEAVEERLRRVRREGGDMIDGPPEQGGACSVADR